MGEEEVVLETLSIFRGLASGEPEAFIREMGGRIQRFAKKTRILYRHEDEPYIGVVAEGAVQVILTDRADREVIAYEVKKGALFGNVWAVIGTDVCSGMSVDVRPKSSLLWRTRRERSWTRGRNACTASYGAIFSPSFRA